MPHKFSGLQHSLQNQFQEPSGFTVRMNIDDDDVIVKNGDQHLKNNMIRKLSD